MSWIWWCIQVIELWWNFWFYLKLQIFIILFYFFRIQWFLLDGYIENWSMDDLSIIHWIFLVEYPITNVRISIIDLPISNYKFLLINPYDINRSKKKANRFNLHCESSPKKIAKTSKIEIIKNTCSESMSSIIGW